MESTVNKRQLTVCAVVLCACLVLVARPVNSQDPTNSTTTLMNTENSTDTVATWTMASDGSDKNGTGSEMNTTIPAQATQASSYNSTDRATTDRVGGLTETQRTIVIAVCAGVGGLLLLIALVASLAYFKVRHNKRRRIRVTTTGPQAQATTGNANESDRQILDA